ncbi:MAG TPA: ubiquinol-cytochrome c reductase iron-sulfur subunit [Bacillota bacterium]|nr:ubiquinol-cytochrome c reductase iron-sulfur subunit [Bacillota bacterium]
MSNKKGVSRRQFLNYTLTGVGGFMAAGIVAPMLRMAVDPVLKASTDDEFQNVGISEDDLTNEPQRVEWVAEQVDAWHTSETDRIAYVFKNDEGEIIAHSPVCTHLGCYISWGENEDYPDQYYCPCHQGRFYKDGTNVAGTPPTRPLDEFEVKVENGVLHIGNIKS